MDALHPKVRDATQVTVIHGHRFDETRLAIQVSVCMTLDQAKFMQLRFH